jgi:hypothetical protein
MEGAPLWGIVRESIFREWDVEGSMDGCFWWVSFGEPRELVYLQISMRDSGRRALKMEHLSLRELC